MSTLPCNLDELKKIGKQYLDVLHDSNFTEEEKHSAWSTVALAFLGLNALNEVEEFQARMLLQVLSSKKLDHDHDLLLQEM